MRASENQFAVDVQGRVSPAWEMIPAPRHIFLMLCNPLHSVTCFELPVYRPSEAERRDPKLYAHNVRKLMVRACLAGAPAVAAEQRRLACTLVHAVHAKGRCCSCTAPPFADGFCGSSRCRSNV